ncbi:MAG: ChaN family lipoprotein, partial [Acidobacteriota bacterium]|nr:ChaN family lipoprotein [Acidobacteriota bacterium]
AQAANPHGGAHLLEAQTLRDASMAYSIADFLKQRRDALVLEVNGTFHSEQRLGVPEQLLHYRPQARSVVVTILPDEGFPNFDAARLAALGDFVIITDPALPRSS